MDWLIVLKNKKNFNTQAKVFFQPTGPVIASDTTLGKVGPKIISICDFGHIFFLVDWCKGILSLIYLEYLKQIYCHYDCLIYDKSH